MKRHKLMNCVGRGKKNAVFIKSELNFEQQNRGIAEVNDWYTRAVPQSENNQIDKIASICQSGTSNHEKN